MSVVDTIYNNINYLFTDTNAVDTNAVSNNAVDTNKWTCSKMSDQLRYTNSFVPLDEYVIATNDTIVNVTIPLDSIAYKTTFYNLNDAINYVKMHLEYYKA
jgi:hypothetical protein